MGVARQASTLAAAGLVEELKAEGEEKGEDELDKLLGIVQEPKIGRLIVEIDGEGAVVTYRFGGVSHVSSPGQRSFTQMRHREGNILKEQVYCERLGSSPLNSGECGRSFSHSIAAIRSASARENAAPELCWLSAAANASTAALSAGNMRTWTGSFTVPPTCPGGGAIVTSFPLSSIVCEPPVRRAQHAHACHAR